MKNSFKNWLPGHEKAVYDHRYVFDEIGYNLKPLDLQAAMGLQQLEKLPALDKARRENWSKLSAIFEPYAQYFHMPVATDKADPCWFAFLLTIKEDAPFSRFDIVEHLDKKHRSLYIGWKSMLLTGNETMSIGTSCTAMDVNGYYPLYTTTSCAETHIGGNGTYHTHVLNGMTYYITINKNFINIF